MRKITFVLATITLVACNQKKESSLQIGEPKEIITKTYDKIEKANWLVGEWENISPEGNLTEGWKQHNDSTLNGKTVFFIAKDSMFTEVMEIFQENDNLIYKTKVSNQNQGKTISFKATAITKNQLVFENTSHDFPQKITYNKISTDSLVAEISGIRDGKEQKETFPMKKK